MPAATLLPRWQKIIVGILLAGCLVMAASLIYMRERTVRKLAEAADAYPIAAASDQPPENVTLEIARDANGALTPVQATMELPVESNARVRALLEHLLNEYALPQSPHPLTASLSAGPAVDEVFLLPLPGVHGGNSPGEMAVVNLHGSFADNHPSGIAVESLTLLSIATTLHDNMPEIAQVRFLVDGQQRATLAGHADLTRAYLTASMPVVPPVGVQPR
jgi:hypothetical protein